MIARVSAQIAQTPEASPSTPSIRLITFAMPTIPITVAKSPRSTSPITGKLTSPCELRSTPPRKGRVKTSTTTPAETGMAAARICPKSLTPAGRSTMSSIMPTAAIAAAPPRIARVSAPPGRKTAPAAQTASRIAAPESFGVGCVCRLRAIG